MTRNVGIPRKLWIDETGKEVVERGKYMLKVEWCIDKKWEQFLNGDSE